MPSPALAVWVSSTGMGTDVSTGMATDTASGQAHLPLLPQHRWEQLLLTDVIYAELLSQLRTCVVGIAQASPLVCFQGKCTVQINYWVGWEDWHCSLSPSITGCTCRASLWMDSHMPPLSHGRDPMGP